MDKMIVVVNGKTIEGDTISYTRRYTLTQLRDLLPKYDMYISPQDIHDLNSYTLMQPTNPNLYIFYDSDNIIKHMPGELQSSIFDRRYKFLGMIGRNCYSSVETFIHDEEDTTMSEIP